jgi:hypothetical protein
MKTAIFGDVIVQLPDDWSGCIAELEDKLKDAAVYTWLCEHNTWLADCFPECAQDVAHELLEVLYADGTDAMFDDMMTDARERYAAAGHKEDKSPELFYECLAVPNFKKYVHDAQEWLGNKYTLAEAYRDSLYLYLERRLEDEIISEFGKSVH